MIQIERGRVTPKYNSKPAHHHISMKIKFGGKTLFWLQSSATLFQHIVTVRQYKHAKIWLSQWYILDILEKSNKVADGAAATDELTQVISCSMQGG